MNGLIYFFVLGYLTLMSRGAYANFDQFSKNLRRLSVAGALMNPWCLAGAGLVWIGGGILKVLCPIVLMDGAIAKDHPSYCQITKL